MVIKNFKDYLDAINEGLIKTHDPNIVLKNALNILHLLNININGTYTNNTIELELPNFYNIPINKVEEIFDVIMVYMVNMGGWFPSKMTITSIHKLSKKSKYSFENLMRNHDVYDNIIISFESKFGDIEPVIPDKLYHLTIKEYEQKILKYGLTPRSKSKLTSHTDRIFLCKTISDCELLSPQMKIYYNSEKDNNIYINGNKKYKKDTNLLILEIDNKDNVIKKLYKDPNYINGYYTLDNIPPKYIKVVKYLR